MIALLLVYLSIIFSIEAGPYHKHMVTECIFYSDVHDYIKCYGPGSAEQLDSWVKKAAEKKGIDLADIKSIELVAVNPSIVLQKGLDVLPNLKYLAVSVHGYDVIQANSFSTMPHIRALFITEAWDTTLDDKALTGLPNLKRLGISTSVTFNLKNVLKEVPTLTYLRIGSNFNLNSIENGDFEGVPNLKELRIYDTSVKEIEPKAFTNLQNLEILNIAANAKLYSLNENIFDGLHIKTLDLGNNVFTSIPHLFGLEKSLEYLDLSYNNIKIIEPSKLTGLTKLKSLDLSHNDIDIIPNAFADLASLDNINLSENKINDIEKDAFKNLVALRKLNLNGNELEDLPDDVFPDNSNLDELHLNGNPIKDVDNLNSKFKQLKILELPKTD